MIIILLRFYISKELIIYSKERSIRKYFKQIKLFFLPHFFAKWQIYLPLLVR
jgi:hypothetical protein